MPAFKSVGLHPWHIQNDTFSKLLELLDDHVQEDTVIAIGETGLDKSITTDYELQNLVFKAQLKLAEALQKPLIIHCVRSYSELLAYRKKSDQNIPWIFHWFNADIQIAAELMRKNCYLSFGHMLFNQQSRAFRSFPEIPADRLFFETDDAGYNIRQVYEQAAKLRNVSEEELRTSIMHNFEVCFHS
jgi:TatD DNase family protein